MKPMKSGFALPIILIIVLVVVIGIVSLGSITQTLPKSQLPSQLNTSTSKQNTDTDLSVEWEIYRNELYGYEIAYPKEWEVVEAKPREGKPSVSASEILFEEQDELHKVSFLESQETLWQGKFGITVFSNPDELDFEQWTSNLKFESAAGVNLAKDVGNMTLGGKPAKRLSIFAFDSNDAVIVSMTGYYPIHIEFTDETPNDPNSEKHQLIYERMLSSFKFLE